MKNAMKINRDKEVSLFMYLAQVIIVNYYDSFVLKGFSASDYTLI
jgi:hypothetical protein